MATRRRKSFWNGTILEIMKGRFHSGIDRLIEILQAFLDFKEASLRRVVRFHSLKRKLTDFLPYIDILLMKVL